MNFYRIENDTSWVLNMWHSC